MHSITSLAKEILSQEDGAFPLDSDTRQTFLLWCFSKDIPVINGLVDPWTLYFGCLQYGDHIMESLWIAFLLDLEDYLWITEGKSVRVLKLWGRLDEN
jgi:hypothetical protein